MQTAFMRLSSPVLLIAYSVIEMNSDSRYQPLRDSPMVVRIRISRSSRYSDFLVCALRRRRLSDIRLDWIKAPNLTDLITA